MDDLVQDSHSDQKNIRIKYLLDHRSDGMAVLQEIVFDLMDQVRHMTGVKSFIDMDGLKFFVDYVVSDHADITVGDLQVFCRNIIIGKYGNSYENISVQKLIMWIKGYREIGRAHV